MTPSGASHLRGQMWQESTAQRINGRDLLKGLLPGVWVRVRDPHGIEVHLAPAGTGRKEQGRRQRHQDRVTSWAMADRLLVRRGDHGPGGQPSPRSWLGGRTWRTKAPTDVPVTLESAQGLSVA